MVAAVTTARRAGSGGHRLGLGEKQGEKRELVKERGRERQGTMPSLTRRCWGGGARRRGRGKVVDTAMAALAMAPVLALSPQ